MSGKTNLATLKSYNTQSDYRFDIKTFTKLKNAQTVTLTIRKFNARRFGLDDLVRIGTVTEEIAGILETAVRSRKNVLISGGTGTGKTTLLNILANFIPKR